MLLKRKQQDNKTKVIYKSSTICASIFENDTKALTVIFNNGGQYKYANVSDTDYTRFETGDSQGIILNSHIKKYPFTKLDPLDVTAILKEIEDLSTSDTAIELVTKAKVMIDAMLRVSAGFVATDKINPTLLEGVEKAISEYNKVPRAAGPSVTPPTSAPSPVIS